MKRVKQIIPLTPAVFHILLTMAKEKKHGYAIMKQIVKDADGVVNIGNGTLYGSIKRMLKDGLIEEVGEQTLNKKRRYYQLTVFGKKTMHAEMARYIKLVLLLRDQRLIPYILLGATKT